MPGSPTRPSCAGLRVAPDLAPRRRVERVHLVDGGDVHHPRDHHRRALDHRHVGNGEEPLHRQSRHVVPVDLVERGVAIPGMAAVIGRPVDGRLDRRLAEGVAVPAQEGDVAAGCPELRVEAALVEDGAVEGAAPGERQRSGPRLRRPRVTGGRRRRRGQLLQVRDERRQLVVRDLDPRHAARRHALGDDPRQSIGLARVHHREDRHGPIAAGGVAAVAQRATGPVRLLSVGGGRNRTRQDEDGGEDGGEGWDSHGLTCAAAVGGGAFGPGNRSVLTPSARGSPPGPRPRRPSGRAPPAGGNRSALTPSARGSPPGPRPPRR